MGPHIPLNFFMTRLLFVEESKVKSLKAAKSGKSNVVIVVDNPRILPEQAAKSLPSIPAPPAAPESPRPIEGRKGIKVGGWINKLSSSSSSKSVNTPSAACTTGGDTDKNDDTTNEETTTEATDIEEFDKLTMGNEDDHTEFTQESSTTFDQETTATSTAATTAVAEPRKQLFPTNSARNLSSSLSTSTTTTTSTPTKKSGKSRLSTLGGGISIPRPLLKKKSSRSSGNALKLQNTKDGSPSSSGAED